MRVIILEDDYLQADWLVKTLKESFGAIDIEVVDSESEFHRSFAKIRKNPPDLVFTDVMVRWALPGPDVPERPDEVKGDAFYRAGFRCLRMLLDAEETRSVPVIVYSVLERDDVTQETSALPPHVLYVQKNSEVDDLIRRIRSLVQGVPETDARDKLGPRIWDSIEAKPGWMGFEVNLKQLLSRRGKKPAR
jgi:DNA-binding NarL/FixJ family response regulator